MEVDYAMFSTKKKCQKPKPNSTFWTLQAKSLEVLRVVDEEKSLDNLDE